LITSIAQIALIVRDYDEAKQFYCEKLGFKLIEDLVLPGKRWVRIAAPGQGGSELVLHKAADAKQLAAVGNQTGGSVLLFFKTDNFDADYQAFKSRGVEFTEQPRSEVYGKVAVMKDLYGNRIDLIQPA